MKEPKAKHVPLKDFYTPKQTFVLTLFLFPLFSQLVVGGFASVFFSAIFAFFNGQTFEEVQQGTTGTYLTFLTLVFVYGFLYLAINALVKIRKYKLSDIGLKMPTSRDIWLGVFGYIAFLLFFLFLNAFLYFLPFIDNQQTQQITDLDASSLGTMITLFLGLVIAAPIVEEIVFRGFLYTGLRSKWKFWPSLLVTSAFFGLVHGEYIPSFNPTAVIVTFFLSFFLVYLREKTDSLTAPIIVHSLNNLLAFLVVFALA